MHRVPPCIFVLPEVVILNNSSDEWLFTRVAGGGRIVGRGAGILVKGERERQSPYRDIEATLGKTIVVS